MCNTSFPPEAPMLFLLQHSLWLHVFAPEEWENKTEQIVLFYADESDAATAEALASFELLSLKYPRKLGAVNCAKTKSICTAMQIQKYPTVQSFAGEVTYTYGEKSFDENHLHQFVEVIAGSIFIDAPNVITFYALIQQNGVKEYFLYYGPDREVGEHLFAIWKGTMRVMWIKADTQQLVAIRNNNSIYYKGPFTREAVAPFIWQNLAPILPKFSQAFIERHKGDYMNLCVFVFNSSEESQKVTGRQFKKYADYHMVEQTYIGRSFQFLTYDVAKNHDFDEMVELTQTSPTAGPMLMFLSKKRDRILGRKVDFAVIDGLLTGIADGTLALVEPGEAQRELRKKKKQERNARQ